VVRTAVAAGFTNVMAGKGTADFYNPKVVRSSAGGLASIHCVQDGDTTLLKGLKRKGYTVFVTDCSRGKDYRRVTYPEKTVLVMGNEGEGVSAQVAGTGDYLINIPLKQRMKSLNIAVAFGILAYEIQTRSTP
jgi:TrmH family RNA methyltransferase